MGCSFNAVFAPNGERSLLFAELEKEIGDSDVALLMWAYTKTADFKSTFGNWEVASTVEKSTDSDALKNLRKLMDSKTDKNGEPLLSLINIPDLILLKESGKLSKLVKPFLRRTKKIEDLQESIDKLIKQKESFLIGKKEFEKAESLHELRKSLKSLSDKSTTLAMLSGIKTELDKAAKSLEIIKNLVKGKGVTQDEYNKDKLSQLSNLYHHSKVLEEFEMLLATLSEDTSFTKAFKEELKEIHSSMNTTRDIKAAYTSLGDTVGMDALVDILNETEDVIEAAARHFTDIDSYDAQLKTLQDSKNPILAGIAMLLDEQTQSARRRKIDTTHRIYEAQKNLLKEQGEKMSPKKLFETFIEDIKGEKHFKKKANARGVTNAWYNNLTKAQKEFYDIVIDDIFINSQKGLYNKDAIGYRIPSVMQSNIEALLSGKPVKDIALEYKTKVQMSLEVSNTDEDQTVDKSAKNLFRDVPMFFTQRFDSNVKDRLIRKYVKESGNLNLKDSELSKIEKQAEKEAIRLYDSAKSLDIAHSIMLYTSAAIDFQEKEAVKYQIEALRETAYNAKYSKMQYGIKGTVAKLKGIPKDVISGAESNTIKALDALINSQLYGKHRDALGEFNVAGIKISSDKILEKIRTSTAFTILGGNVLAGTVNIIQGQFNQMIEMAAGEFYNSKDYAKANAFYAKNFGNTLADVINREDTCIINHMNLEYDFLGNFAEKGSTDLKTTGTGVGQWISRTSLAFALQSSGEHLLQSTSALAVMQHIKTYDETGKEIGTVLSAHSVNKKTNKLEIADVYIKNDKGDLVKYSVAERSKMSRKVRALNREMHGNYSKDTEVLAQRNALMNMVYQFRKWIAPGIERRWGKNRRNYFLDADRAGYYSDSARILGNFIKRLKNENFALMTVMNSTVLSAREKANLRRMTAEITATLLLILAATALGGTDDDDEKSIGELMMQYTVARVYKESTFFYNPASALGIIQNPAASSAFLARVLKVFSRLTGETSEVYEKGPREGDSKLYHELVDLFVKNRNQLSKEHLNNAIRYMDKY